MSLENDECFQSNSGLPSEMMKRAIETCGPCKYGDNTGYCEILANQQKNIDIKFAEQQKNFNQKLEAHQKEFEQKFEKLEVLMTNFSKKIFEKFEIPW